MINVIVTNRNDMVEKMKLKIINSAKIKMEIDCSLKVNRSFDHHTQYSLTGVVGFSQRGGHQWMTRAMTQTSPGMIRMLR